MKAESLPLQRIFLLRHAQAAWPAPGESDFDRVLDDRGRIEATILAGIIAGKGHVAERIVSSPARRCKETAEIVSRAFGRDVPLRFAEELYNGMMEAYLSVIAVEKDVSTLMIVGHNPTIEELLETLAGPDAAYAEIASGYPTAGFTVLDRDNTAPGGWTLTEFIAP